MKPKRRQYTADPKTALRLLMPTAQQKIVTESLRMNTALAMLAAHKHPGQSEWETLADAVNMVETLIVEMGRVSRDELPTVSVATDAMAESARRWQAGQGLRLSGPGLQAMRDVVAVYEACLGELTAAEVDRMRQITATRVAEFVLGRNKTREVIAV